jgi:hypothetical protein
MKKFTSVCAFALVVGACSGSNPFAVVEEADPTIDDPATDDSTTDETGIPENIAGDLERIVFDADNQTLVVTGLTQDGTAFNNSYAFVSDGQQTITTSAGTTYNAYVEGYTTFTQQNDAIGRHSTAFVASREGLQAGVVITGGQFNRFFSGSFYERTGDYNAPTAPEERFDVTYHGTYAGGLNNVGPNTDLLPIDGSLDDDIDVPAQSAYVRGLVFVNVDLNDLSVEGQIYNRTGVLNAGQTGESDVPGFLDLADLVLVEGTLTDDGTFSGNIEVDDAAGTNVGEFAGVIAGEEGESLAGGTFLNGDFDDNLASEIEYGVFVLDLCQAGDTDPVCVNALP